MGYLLLKNHLPVLETWRHVLPQPGLPCRQELGVAHPLQVFLHPSLDNLTQTNRDKNAMVLWCLKFLINGSINSLGSVGINHPHSIWAFLSFPFNQISLTKNSSFGLRFFWCHYNSTIVWLCYVPPKIDLLLWFRNQAKHLGGWKTSCQDYAWLLRSTRAGRLAINSTNTEYGLWPTLLLLWHPNWAIKPYHFLTINER